MRPQLAGGASERVESEQRESKQSAGGIGPHSTAGLDCATSGAEVRGTIRLATRAWQTFAGGRRSLLGPNKDLGAGLALGRRRMDLDLDLLLSLLLVGRRTSMETTGSRELEWRICKTCKTWAQWRGGTAGQSEEAQQVLVSGPGSSRVQVLKSCPADGAA